MTEWKTIQIKVKKEESDIIDLIATNYKMSRNKLIKNILGNYLQGEIQMSIINQLQMQKVLPREMLDEYNEIIKRYGRLEDKANAYVNDPEVKKTSEKNGKKPPNSLEKILNKHNLQLDHLQDKGDENLEDQKIKKV